MTWGGEEKEVIENKGMGSQEKGGAKAPCNEWIIVLVGGDWETWGFSLTHFFLPSYLLSQTMGGGLARGSGRSEGRGV